MQKWAAAQEKGDGASALNSYTQAAPSISHAQGSTEFSSATSSALIQTNFTGSDMSKNDLMWIQDLSHATAKNKSAPNPKITPNLGQHHSIVGYVSDFFQGL